MTYGIGITYKFHVTKKDIAYMQDIFKMKRQCKPIEKDKIQKVLMIFSEKFLQNEQESLIK